MPRKKYKEKRKRYFLRMQSAGVWYFLLRVSHDKKSHCMKPIWWPERMQGASEPYLFKTLVGARDAQDRYVSALATQSQIAEWKDDAALKDKSA